MLEITEEEIQTANMDHHGLVAALCKDLKIAKRIDERLEFDSQRKVSPGQAVVAMILNGLGFTNRRLYLTHQFFGSKPIGRLLGSDLCAEDLTDYTLGHALDDISAYGASKLFAEVAFAIALENDLLDLTNHLDMTRFSVHGSYEIEDDPQVIEITHGYSKDHRPDLKQAVLSLVVNGPSSMPLWMEPLDGNSSDKTSFHETVKRVGEFQKQIDLEKKFKWVADSALYTKDKLLKSNDYNWLTRVPETIGEAKNLLEKADGEITWIDQEKGYKTCSFVSHYGGIEQRWLLVFSSQAYQREKKTLEKKLIAEDQKLKQQLWHLGKEEFACEGDALRALRKIEQKAHLYQIESQVVSVWRYAKCGRPKEGEEQMIKGYRIKASFERNSPEINMLLNRKGRFILATNDIDRESYTDQAMLEEYKDQQSVERGFRFLKDPWFMVDSIFLKLPRRVEALMMIMTLCLMVYNIGQYKLRQKLEEEKDTLPNQLGKEVKNPTLRWVFQIMEGIGLVRFCDASLQGALREVITNLNKLRKKIITLFGKTASCMYGLIQRNFAEV
jgi:transposase